MTLHDDRTFIRHFSWVLVALVAITIFFIFMAFLIVGETGVDNHSGYSYVEYMKSHPGHSSSTAAQGSSQKANGNGQGSSAAATGTKSVASNGTSGKPNGKAIWKAHCSACHETGVAGAPKIGDTKEWGPILAKTSKATLYKHAINGFKGKRGYMPPKGGASGLSNAEVKAAVDYMVGKSKG